MHWLLGREKKEDEAGFGIATATMFSCVGCFWVLLSSALVAVCSFSFISPAWIVKEQLRSGHHFGLLWHCSESLDHMYRCYTFGGLGKFAEIPSSSWQTSAVLCSGGCALLAVSSLLAIITIFLPGGGCERRICTLAGYMQMASGEHTCAQRSAEINDSVLVPQMMVTNVSTPCLFRMNVFPPPSIPDSAAYYQSD
uniref:Uncharacterized protein n=1 Tax=Poecilia mexicana TaxID=48701 RepID=A0A3B3XET4_9TELE